MERITTLDGKVLELAIYRVNPGSRAAVDGVRAQLAALFGGMKGFSGYVPLDSLESPDTLVDYLLWDTLADAKASADAFAEMPEGKRLLEGVQDIILFEHFAPAPIGAPLPR